MRLSGGIAGDHQRFFPAFSIMNISHAWMRDGAVCLQSINALIAKKMTEDRGRDYMTARRVAKEYEAVTRGLDKSAPSVPPENSYQEVKQVSRLFFAGVMDQSLCWM